VPGPKGRASGAVPADPPATTSRTAAAHEGGAIAGTVTEGVCPIHALVIRPSLRWRSLDIGITWLRVGRDEKWEPRPIYAGRQIVNLRALDAVPRRACRHGDGRQIEQREGLGRSFARGVYEDAPRSVNANRASAAGTPETPWTGHL